MKKNAMKLVSVLVVMILVIACIGCSIKEEGAKISDKVDGIVTKIAEMTNVNQLVETDEQQETITRLEPIGTVVQESIIMNEDYEYSIEIPESWFGKVSYVVDESALIVYHVTIDSEAMEINPEMIHIDVVEGSEVDLACEELAQVGGYSYVYCPRFDFPYEPNTKDGKEYTLLSADIESILSAFWVNEE